MSGRRLTVLQMLPDLAGGGVERGTIETAHALVEAGHRALVMSAGGRLVSELVAGGAEHIARPIGRKSPATLRQLGPLRRILRERSVDVLHARSRVPAWLALLAHRSLPAAARPHLMTTMHGLHSVGRFSSVMTRGQTVVAVSRTVRDHIATHYRHCCDAAAVRVIRNGIDHDRFPHGFEPPGPWREAFFAEHPQLIGRRLLTLIGRLTRLKGHHDLLAALDRLPRDYHAVIVGGEDPRRAGYAAEIREAAAARAGRVTLTGHRSDAREIAAISEAVLSLSTKPESFGRSVLEALALGVPVVGYSHGGVAEILGELFPEGRVAVGDVVGVAEQIQRIAQGNRQPAAFDSFALADTLAARVALYEEVAGKPSAMPLRRAA